MFSCEKTRDENIKKKKIKINLPIYLNLNRLSHSTKSLLLLILDNKKQDMLMLPSALVSKAITSPPSLL